MENLAANALIDIAGAVEWGESEQISSFLFVCFLL